MDKEADPTTIGENGWDVTYTVTVTSCSDEAQILDSLIDDVYGDLDGKGTCLVPQGLAPQGDLGDSYTCSFTEFVSGAPDTTQTNVVTGSASDDDGNSVEDTGQADVNIVPSTGQITETGTTCNDVFLNDPPTFTPLTEALYGTKDGMTINNIAPGVYFYYTKVIAPATTFVVDIYQTNPDRPPWYPISPMKVGQIVLYDSTCTKQVDTATYDSLTGTATISVDDSTIVPDDTVFYIGIKYNANDAVGTDISSITEQTYSYTTFVNGNLIPTSLDTITIKPK